jgi:hypothetical protein
MAKTLEDIMNESDKQDAKGDVKGTLKSLIEALKNNEDDKISQFKDMLSGVMESNKSLTETMKKVMAVLEKIANRPDPKFPQPIDHSDVLKQIANRADAPLPEPIDHEAIGEAVARHISPHIQELTEGMRNEHGATRGILNDILNKDSAVYAPEPAEKASRKSKGDKFTIGGGVGSIRRRARWEIATYPNIVGTAAITSKGDGLNYYLPFAPIKNSETIRLNGGLPLSQGVDYTLTGNNLLFVQNQSGSQIEMRAQN